MGDTVFPYIWPEYNIYCLKLFCFGILSLSWPFAQREQVLLEFCVLAYWCFCCHLLQLQVCDTWGRRTRRKLTTVLFFESCGPSWFILLETFQSSNICFIYVAQSFELYLEEELGKVYLFYLLGSKNLQISRFWHVTLMSTQFSPLCSENRRNRKNDKGANASV